MNAEFGPKHLFLIYVASQERSKLFYQRLFRKKPYIDVPGMTQFDLPGGVARLGILPEKDVAALISNKIAQPEKNQEVPRSEIYIFVDDPDEYFLKLIEAGGRGLRPGVLQYSDAYVAYGADPDGHVWAFAKNST